MLHYAMIFLVIAIIAGILGFGGNCRDVRVDCPHLVCGLPGAVHYFSDLSRKTICLA